MTAPLATAARLEARALTLPVAAAAGVLVGERLGPGRGWPALALAGACLLCLSLARGLGAARGQVLAAGVLVALAAVSTQRALDGVAGSPLAAAARVGCLGVITGRLVDDPDPSRFTTRARLRASHFDCIEPVGGRPAPTTDTAGTDTAGAHLDHLDAHVAVMAREGAAARLRLLSAGELVVLEGRLGPLGPRDAWLRRRHAVAGFDARDLLDARPARGPLPRVAQALRGVVTGGIRDLPPDRRALTAGVLLGDTRDLPRAAVDDFRASGLSHLVAVSGANVAFVLALVGPALARLGLRGRFVAGLAVLVLFGAATRWEPSVLRAVGMAGTAMLATLLGRPQDGLRIFAVAVTALLLADPFLLGDVGFQLSCAASVGIVVLARPLEARLARWQRLPRAREALAVTAAAQVGVAPVSLTTFGALPLVSLVTNVVAAPVAAALSTWGFGAGLVGGIARPWWPELTAMLQVPTEVLAGLLLRIASTGARAPLWVGTRDLAAGLALACAGGAALAGVTVRSHRHADPPARRDRPRRHDPLPRHGDPQPDARLVL